MALAVVGKSVVRRDALEKALGQAAYLDDVVLPKVLIGKVLRSDYAHAKIIRIDTGRAKALPGVKAVITADDLPGARHGPFVKDTPILATGKVLYVGEPVAAVAAVDEETANDALTLIEVEYEQLPVVLDPVAAMSDDSPLVHENLLSYPAVFSARRWGNVCSHTRFNLGDVEKGFREADHAFEDTFRTQEVHQAYLEPHGAIASFDAAGKVTVWTTTQSVFHTQASISETLLIPASKIRVISTRVGGGFGGKVEAITQPIAVALAQKTGRPVKVVFTRDEELAGTRPRHPSIVDIKTGVKKNGTIVARQVRFVLDTGAYADDGPGIVGFAALCATGPYKIPNVLVTGYGVHTNKTPCGAYRGFGNPQVTFAFESQMDLIAEQLGIDALELRLKNAVENGDINIAGQVMPSVGLKECLRKAAEAAGWGKPRTGPNRGLGVSCLHHSCGVLPACANVRLNQDGTVTLLTGAGELGQGSETILSQIVAEELGVPVEDINIVMADTDATPYNWATCASRITYTMGNAVRLAAAEAKKKIKALAAEKLEANPSDIEVADRHAYVSGSPERKLSFHDLAAISHWVQNGPILGEASFMAQGNPYQPGAMEGFPFRSVTGWVFGAHVAEVEVDRETGQVQVLRVAAAHDVGQAVNPRNIEGQIEGGFGQGLGYALFEEIVRDNGKVVNPSFVDYRLPTTMDMPQMTPIIVEEREPTGPFGAKGVGEPGLVAAAPAIANAIYASVGIRLKELPMTSEKVRKALLEKPEQERKQGGS
ncbi:MAG: xanthine dehydrogenase family protein molybdopterin-binding subunit [Chloroflexi bacterium]|nr:xanthine dehydrogenase family protein molybdopterin-binding subunit [Chloroflexota bacterium]